MFVQSLECGEHVVNCFLNVSILADCEPGEAELCHLNNPVKCCSAAAATKRVARHLVVIIHKMGLTRLNHNHIYQLNTNPEIRPVQWRNFNNIYPKYILFNSNYSGPLMNAQIFREQLELLGISIHCLVISR